MEDRKCVFSLWIATVRLRDRSLRGCWQGPSCNFFHLSSNGREDSRVQNNLPAPQAFHGHVNRGEYYVNGLSKTGQVLVNKAGPITNPHRQGKRGFTSVWCHSCCPSSRKVTRLSCAFLPPWQALRVLPALPWRGRELPHHFASAQHTEAFKVVSGMSWTNTFNYLEKGDFRKNL